jgi:hypothetical protein
MKNLTVRVCLFASILILSLTAFGQTESAETTKLSMVSDNGKVSIKVENGEIINVSVDGKDVPKDRVRLVGKGLEVVDGNGKIIGAMANLSANGKSPLRPNSQREPIKTYNDNPELKIEIKDSRFLVVTLNGKVIPANQIKFEEDALKIYNENGDVIRVIRADSPKE